MNFVENHLLFMLLYFSIFSPLSVTLWNRVVHQVFFFFNFQRLVRPQGYYQDLRSILHPRSSCMQSRSPTQRAARFPGSEKTNADEYCWRLDWMEDLYQLQNGFTRIARFSKRCKAVRKCSCRKNVFNLLYLNRLTEAMMQWRNVFFGIKKILNMILNMYFRN